MQSEFNFSWFPECSLLEFQTSEICTWPGKGVGHTFPISGDKAWSMFLILNATNLLDIGLELGGMCYMLL